MATFLTLTNLVLGRLNEVILNSSTFSTATGVQLNIQNAVNAAVADISRREQQWPFNYGQQNFSTVVGVQEYTPPASVSTIKWDTFGITRNDSSSPAIVAATLTELDYNEWARSKRWQDQQANATNWTVPAFVVKGDDGKIILSGPPGQIMNVYYDAWANQAAMVNWNDTCNVPDIYNYVIGDGTIWYGYDFRSDTQAQDRAKSKFDEGVKEIQRQLIKPTDGFKSTMIINTRTMNSIPSRYGL